MREESELLAKQRIKVAIFGAGGAVGSILVSFLQQLESVSQIVCIDSNLERTYKYLKNRKKIIHVITNGNRNEKLRWALKNCFLVINAASSKLNRELMAIAWEIGALYFDFASFDNLDAEQEKSHERFIEKNIAAWINWGIGPGLTNTLAAKLINGLDDCVVKIRVAEHTKLKKEKNGKEPLIFLWKPDLVVDEITSPVYVPNKDPRHTDIVREPFSGPETCIFPYPIGKTTCRYMNENEVITMKNLQNILTIDVKTGGDDIERLFKKLPKITKMIKRDQIEKYLKNVKTPSPDEIKKMVDEGTILDGRVAITVEVDGEDPRTEERILRKATWMGLSLREVPRGTHVSFNTAIIAFCAILQMFKMAKEEKLKPGVFAPEYLSAEGQDAILACVSEKTNPVHFE